MTQILVLAKAPAPGLVKTRLCPPCTPAQAAAIAAAALVDTLATVDATRCEDRTLVVAGAYRPPRGWRMVEQRGHGLGVRLAHAYRDTARPGVASLLIGMDTPQITPALLGSVADGLATADAVLAPADDGGWWALALRDPAHAHVLAGVPMSTADTGRRTLWALSGLGLSVALGPQLRDVDTAADAREVAATCPNRIFAAAVRHHLPARHSDLPVRLSDLPVHHSGRDLRHPGRDLTEAWTEADRWFARPAAM
jgi:uncharacterized protein